MIPSQKNNNRSPFHRSVVIVALIHLGLIGLIIFLVKPVKKVGSQVTWLETGSFAAPAPVGEETSSSQEEDKAEETHPSITTPQPKEEAIPETFVEAKPEIKPEIKPEPTPEPTPEIKPEPTPEVSTTPPPLANSEIAMATPTPQTPPLPTPKATPKPKPKPKPTPKPTPKASPKPKPKVKEEKEEEKPVSSPKSKIKKTSSSHKTSTTPTTAKKSGKKSSTNLSAKKGTADHGSEDLKKAFLGSKNGTGKGTEGSGNTSGSRGDGINAGILAGYHELIHDRFYSQWEQPTAIPTEHKHDFVCTLRLTIERDGTISNFSLAKPSGNPVMDESVLAAAAKVKQIAPLPEGLNQNSSYTVNINFELE